MTPALLTRMSILPNSSAATAAPSATSARTVASPMPLEAPVTTATLPFNLSPMCITSLWVRELQRGSSALCQNVSVRYPITFGGPIGAYACSKDQRDDQEESWL